MDTQYIFKRHQTCKPKETNTQWNFKTQTNLIICQKFKFKLISAVIWNLKSIIHQNQYSKLYPYLSKLKSNHQS